MVDSKLESTIYQLYFQHMSKKYFLLLHSQIGSATLIIPIHKYIHSQIPNLPPRVNLQNHTQNSQNIQKPSP